MEKRKKNIKKKAFSFSEIKLCVDYTRVRINIINNHNTSTVLVKSYQLGVV